MASPPPASATPANGNNLAASAAAAAAYSRWGEPLTSQFVPAALAAAGPIGPTSRVLDVATGTGVAAVAAAAAGAAEVLAIDFSPGMVAVAAGVLAPYPAAKAVVMDGTALDVPTGAYDVVLSVFGVVTFPDWQAGLAEAVRAAAPGGRVVLTTWASSRGGGFVSVFMDTYVTTFPDKKPPVLGPGVDALATAAALVDACTSAGLERVTVEDENALWTGPHVDSVVTELDPMLRRFPFYAALDDAERATLSGPLQAALARYADEADGMVRIPCVARVTVAYKPCA